MVLVTVACLLFAIFVDTIYGIYILSADILYIIVFPQLLCAVFIKFVNPYGSLVGYVVGAILRVGGGESTLNIDTFIEYPNYDEELGQLFPFRTFAMLCGLMCIIGVSLFTNYVFDHGLLPRRIDIFGRISRGSKIEDSHDLTGSGTSLQSGGHTQTYNNDSTVFT